MIRTGLVSVTFRPHTPQEIIQWTVEAGLDAIEWGGDIHVPHGNVERAREVGDRTRSAGLQVSSYGSYYRLNGGDPFEPVLETAQALGAPSIRVWAGNRGTQDADEAWREAVAEDARRIAALAEACRIRIDLEYHGGTLTDTADSAKRLMEQACHANLRLYWQPAWDQDPGRGLADLRLLSSYLGHFHVFHWTQAKRRPLAEGEADWRCYLNYAASLGGERYAMLEFVEDDRPEHFLRDAKVLKRLVREANSRACSGLTEHV